MTEDETASRRHRQNVYAHHVQTRDGADFMAAFLRSGVVRADQLRRLAPRGTRSAPIDERIAGIIGNVDAGELSAAHVVRAMCKHKAVYVALRTGSCDRTTAAGDLDGIPTSLGDDATWHGPVFDVDTNDLRADLEGDGPVSYYVYSMHAPHYEMIAMVEGQVPAYGVRTMRWHIVARITDDHASFHWDGFTFTPKRQGAPGSFPFWEHVDGAIAELGSLLGARWEPVNLEDLVFNKLFHKYGRAGSKYDWKHLGVTTEQDGLRMRANSTAVSRLVGLEVLTKGLTKTLANKFREWRIDVAQQEVVSRVLLFEIVRHYGTQSYEFEISPTSRNADAENEDVTSDESAGRLFRGRVHLGNQVTVGGRTTPDSLAHVMTHVAYGGSIGAAKFLLENLRD